MHLSIWRRQGHWNLGFLLFMILSFISYLVSAWWDFPQVLCWVLPARFGNDHLRADVVEALPEVGALQLHPDLFHGRGRRGIAGRGAQVRWGVERAWHPVRQALAVWPGTGFWICPGRRKEGSDEAQHRRQINRFCCPVSCFHLKQNHLLPQCVAMRPFQTTRRFGGCGAEGHVSQLE